MEWSGLTTDLNAFDNPQDSAENFAQYAVALYQQQALWLQKQEYGYQILKANFDKDTIQAKLLTRIVDVQANLGTHRSNNFIGTMLQHHQLKSTQYMAQWIEAKNR